MSVYQGTKKVSNINVHTFSGIGGGASDFSELTGFATVPQGGTGLQALTIGSALIGNGTEPITLRAITDIAINNALTATTNLVTVNTLLNKLPNINNVAATATGYKATTTSGIYAPIAGGTISQILKGNGMTSAPIWGTLGTSDIPTGLVVAGSNTTVTRNASGVYTVDATSAIQGPQGPSGTSVNAIQAANEAQAISLSSANPNNIYYW